mmetsp:Transcript_19729/g.61053  ORF Transcript_19729/g.61053 Transcript_19729/m.61053 type:complete len:256 (-) Transcript_19729:561-1328(-)
MKMMRMLALAALASWSATALVTPPCVCNALRRGVDAAAVSRTTCTRTTPVALAQRRRPLSTTTTLRMSSFGDDEDELPVRKRPETPEDILADLADEDDDDDDWEWSVSAEEEDDDADLLADFDLENEDVGEIMEWPDRRKVTVANTRKEYKEKFGRHPTDCGSSEVQIALFTARIKHITEHVVESPKDHASRRGLLALVSKRRRLLNYLYKHKPDVATQLVSDLGIRFRFKSKIPTREEKYREFASADSKKSRKR